MTNDDENMFAVEQHKALSRRRFLTGSVRTLGAALASAGIYELIDTIAQPPERPAFAATQPLQEQYIIQNLQIIKDNGSGTNSSNGTIPVIVHPLHSHVITAKLNGSNAVAMPCARYATPPAGTFQKLGRPRLIQSLWMGVEKLLADPGLPKGVPIARLIDPGMVAAMTEMPAQLQCGLDRFDRHLVLIGQVAHLGTTLKQLRALGGR